MSFADVLAGGIKSKTEPVEPKTPILPVSHTPITPEVQTTIKPEVNTPIPVKNKRRGRNKVTVDIYADQYERMRVMIFEAGNVGDKLTQAMIIRKALDVYFKKLGK